MVMDIVERLRDAEQWNADAPLKDTALFGEAADEIERLQEKIFNLETEVHFDDQTIKSLQVINERLREALTDIANIVNPYEDADTMQEIARAALKEGE